jgi:hypothetical protein
MIKLSDKFINKNFVINTTTKRGENIMAKKKATKKKASKKKSTKKKAKKRR